MLIVNFPLQHAHSPAPVSLLNPDSFSYETSRLARTPNLTTSAPTDSNSPKMSDPSKQTQENPEVPDPPMPQDDLSDLLAAYPFSHKITQREDHEAHELNGVSMNRSDLVALLDAYAALDSNSYIPDPNSDLKQLEPQFYLTDNNISPTNTRHVPVLIRHFLINVATMPHLDTLVINTDVPLSATQSPETELLQTRFIKEIMREVIKWFVDGGEKIRVIMCARGPGNDGDCFGHILTGAGGKKVGVSVSAWEEGIGVEKRSGLVWRRVSSSAVSLPRRASV